MKKGTLLFILVILSISLKAQDDWGKLLTKAIGDEGSKQKAAIDSIDFPFAMSVNDNAGLFDVKQKGEGLSKGLYSLKDRGDKDLAEIARDTLDVAIGYYNARMYKFAESSFMQAKQFMEENELQNEVNYIRCLSNLGVVYLAQGKLEEAEEYINYSLEKGAERGKSSVVYIANLNSKAKLEQSRGKYNDAEQHYDEALKGVQKKFANGLQTAIVMNNKALLYQALGRFDEAIELMNQAITLNEASSKSKVIKDKGSFDNRRFQSNLALLYQLSGKLPEAEKIFLAQKKIYENRGNQNNPEYASLLNQLAVLYIQMNKTSEVEPLLTKASTVYKKKFTEENPYYAKSISDLGTFYRITGKYPQAETNLLKALAIRERVLGNSHPDYSKTKEELAITYWKMNQWDKATEHYKVVMDNTIDFINQYFPPMSEAEKTSYWDITAPRFQRFYNFALEALASKPELAHDLYDYHIATKALLLNTTNKIKQSILNSKDASLIKDYLLWLDKKEQLARLYSLSKEELKQQKIDLKVLENEANSLERSLSSRSADFSQGYSTQKISFKQIASLLLDTEAALEIVRVQRFDQQFTAESRYVALVLTKGATKPSVVILDNGQQLETRYIKYYRNMIQQKQADDVSFEQYWSTIDPLLTGKKVLYLSLDGAFNQLNINTLKKPGGNYLVSSYEIALLGNTKDLLELKKRKSSTPKKSALLLGFPDYGGTELAALPGTKVEIDGISKMLKTAGYQISQFVQKEATEKNLKAIKAPELLHIATHGYFLKDVESGGNAFGVEAENALNNPLLRSGLMLAGASKTVSGQTSPTIESNDNGILTAYEAMNLNLEGTQLIVLSACETGLGDVKNGEGVYGLQRAFLVAGADALIMSLWKVDDAATQLLMTNFYTNWIKLRDKQKAFKQAQLQLMTKYKEPYYWGAFVMIGL
jgi:CHAT domain-containing protein/Flp pilus assembly protein TadD